MEIAEFDQFADEYESMHAANIAITGEQPDFFAAYKVRQLKLDAERLNLPTSAIIDFGSGTGNSVPHFRRHFPESALTCADVSRRSLDVANARFPGQSSELLMDGNSIPATDECYDIAFSACVFHHIPHAEHEHWLRELARVVRPGGALVIFEHNPLNPLTVHSVNTCPFDENAHLIRSHVLKARLRASGWSDVTVRYHIFFPRPLARLRVIEPKLTWLPLGAQYSVLARK